MADVLESIELPIEMKIPCYFCNRGTPGKRYAVKKVVAIVGQPPSGYACAQDFNDCANLGFYDSLDEDIFV